MSVLVQWLGTLCMCAGFAGTAFGVLLLRLRPHDVGRMYLATTMMGGGEMTEGWVNRLLLECRANDRARRRVAWGIVTGGLLVSLAGAALAGAS